MSLPSVISASLAVSVSATLLASAVFLPSPSLRAGSLQTESRADKDVATQQRTRDRFPLSLSLSAGIDSYFMFRGINLLPEQRVNTAKAANPIFQNLFAGLLTRQEIKDIVFDSFPTDTKIARESAIAYFDAALTYNAGPKIGRFTTGAFYALQTQERIVAKFLDDEPLFRTYEELDYFFTWSRAFGPVEVSLGGTYYHVRKSATFDTLELNFRLDYTPKQFRYVTASFAYNYSGDLNYDPEYLDGHYLETRLTGNLPFFNNRASFNPYVMLSAGQGVVPRAFNTLDFPTFFTQQKYAALIQPVLLAAIDPDGNLAGDALANATANAAQTFDPAVLDRELDLNNFQTGFRLSFQLTSFLTLTGNANYSRPLGNLRGEPYSQKDTIWGGASMNVSF